MFVAQSFAKNFGLYSRVPLTFIQEIVLPLCPLGEFDSVSDERVGNLTVIVADVSVIPAVKSQISLIVRANWSVRFEPISCRLLLFPFLLFFRSNPPNHGAKIVHMVLTNADLLKEW